MCILLLSFGVPHNKGRVTQHVYAAYHPTQEHAVSLVVGGLVLRHSRLASISMAGSVEKGVEAEAVSTFYVSDGRPLSGLCLA